LSAPGALSNNDAISHKFFEEALIANKPLTLHNLIDGATVWRPRVSAGLWLISNPRIYLTGFLKRGNRPKTGKDSQKVARKKHGARPFTMLAFTILGVYPVHRPVPRLSTFLLVLPERACALSGIAAGAGARNGPG
jgi:hypothetical protein